MNIKQAESMRELIQMYDDGVFDVENEAHNIKVPREGHVFDEDKYVKWNREQRELLMEQKKQARRDYYEKSNEAESNLWDQVDRLFAQESRLSKEQIGIIRIKAYADHHSEGFMPVIDEMDELIDLIKDVMNT